jgi:hypothetical protein
MSLYTTFEARGWGTFSLISARPGKPQNAKTIVWKPFVV